MTPQTTSQRQPGRVLCLAVTLGAVLAGCPPKYPHCKDDSHCADKGEVCVNEVCKQCRDDKQCKPGYECKEGACLEKPECDKNEDCKDDMICKDHKCVPQCTTDKDCAENEKCENKKCVPRNECDDEHACPEGKTCVDNKCTEPVSKPDAGGVVPETACTLGPIYFEFNDFALSEASRTQIDKNADCIKKNNRAVTVQGNTDERGTDEYNIVLGNKRADSVRRYLVQLGVPEDHVNIVSFGKEKPADPGHDEAAWAKNRRDETVWR